MHIVLTAKSDELASGLRSKIINRFSSDAKWKYRTFSASEEYIYSDTADNFISSDRPSLLFILEQPVSAMPGKRILYCVAHI